MVRSARAGTYELGRRVIDCSNFSNSVIVAAPTTPATMPRSRLSMTSERRLGEAQVIVWLFHLASGSKRGAGHSPARPTTSAFELLLRLRSQPLSSWRLHLCGWRSRLSSWIFLCEHGYE